MIREPADSEGVNLAAKVYLDEGDIRVTKAQLTISGQSIRIKDIVSVDLSKEEQLGCLPNTLIGLGVLVALAGFILGQGLPVLAVGVIIIAGGVLWYRRLAPTYYLLLNTLEGKMRILDTGSRGRAERVHAALKEALG